jgi:hypothetical protein
MTEAQRTKVLVLLALVVLLGGISSSVAACFQSLKDAWIFGILGAALLLLAFAGLGILAFSKTSGAADESSTRPLIVISQEMILLGLVVLGIAVVGGTFIWIGRGITLDAAKPELTLPLVVLVGVVVLLITLALVAVTFSILNMSDKGQALALPEGSVRAVIALMLLLIFAIAAFFLYSNVAASGTVVIAKGMSYANVVELKRNATVLKTDPDFPDKPPGGDVRYDVQYRNPESLAANDLAKQLIVLLGTLVTAVSSFYFGSSSVSSAQAALTRARFGIGGPNASTVTPATLKTGGGSQALTIGGDNLANVNAVKLVSQDEKTQLAADDGSIKATASTVTCTVTVATSAPSGSYDVVVSDNGNNSSKVPNGIVINSTAPSPSKVSSAALTVGGSSQPLTISGANLGNVTGVALIAPDGKTPPIPADKGSIKATRDTVDCTVTIPSGSASGTYQVELSDGKNSVKVPKGVEVKPPEGASDGNPTPSAINSVLTADGNTQTLVISGTNLGAVTSVQLLGLDASGKAIDATSVAATPESVTCKFTLPRETQPGAYSVVLIDKSGKKWPVPGSVTIPGSQQ